MTKEHAEDLLMQRFEDFAASLGERGARRADGAKYFPSRQMARLRKAHADGTLLDELVANQYRYDPSKRWTDRMVENARDIVDGGETMWEEFLADPDAPWASWVPAAKRAELNALITRVYEEVARLRRARANARAAIDARRRDAR